MRSLDVSPDGGTLMALGRNAQHKPALVLWNISAAATGGCEAPVVARHISEVDVKAVKWPPYAPGHLVACGRDSVRLLRVKVRLMRTHVARFGCLHVSLHSCAPGCARGCARCLRACRVGCA